jgi:hypothetical protein
MFQNWTKRIQEMTKTCQREDCSIISHGSITTLIAWTPSYDKNGNLQGEDPNDVISRYECRTCGKQWQIASGGGRTQDHITLIKT